MPQLMLESGTLERASCHVLELGRLDPGNVSCRTFLFVLVDTTTFADVKATIRRPRNGVARYVEACRGQRREH